MNATRIRPGFTLLEMLTASVLLGLLVTLLLSLFNQGEIAWSVGKTTAAETGRRSRSLARAAREGAETVFVTKPTPSALRLLPAWEANGEVRTTRPFMRVDRPAGGGPGRPADCAGGDRRTVGRESGCRRRLCWPGRTMGDRG